MGKCVCFFPSENSPVSARKSHSSGVLGLVVRYLLFNPEVLCSNRCVCANFFYTHSKEFPFPFFLHYETSPFFGFVRLFWSFSNVPEGSPSFFVIFCNRMVVEKIPKGPLFYIYMRLLKILISCFVFENF